VSEAEVDGLGVWFIAHGDRPAVADLLSDLTHIGAKTNIGYGKVAHISYHDLPPSRYAGLMTPTGDVLRPIPKDSVESSAMKPRRYSFAEEAYRPPYWREHRTTCYVPAQRFWDYPAIMTMVGG
jgi:CRISPR type IV-associated protein Csf3